MRAAAIVASFLNHGSTQINTDGESRGMKDEGMKGFAAQVELRPPGPGAGA